MPAPKECANCGAAREGGTLIRSLAAAALAGSLVLFAAQSVGQQLKKTPRVDPAVAVDSALRPLLPANEPGGTVIITDKGRVVFRKAYGMADLEHKIALKPEMVLRIGSVTKQFTS